MKERPILFSGEMVKAILEGRKTQTRRVVKPQPTCCSEVTSIEHHENPKCDNWLAKINGATLGIMQVSCPYGKPGDRLWVKETFCEKPFMPGIVYRATCDGIAKDNMKGGKWKPSIFMPRWASRITLEIVSVRVERLHSITEEDAIAEGIEFIPSIGTWSDYMNDSNSYTSARQSYASLWESINGVDSWDDNPWVWVIEFKRI